MTHWVSIIWCARFLFEYLAWYLEGKTLTQSMIEHVHLGLKLHVGVGGEVTILRGILADKTIHVLG